VGGGGGGGDGSATFNVPDMRGEFVRGYDPTNVRDPEGRTRAFGNHQGATRIPAMHTWCNGTGTTQRWISFADNAVNTGDGPQYYDSAPNGSRTVVFTTANALQPTASIQRNFTPRPTNINLLPCIRCK
jgi:microcystin-dependent protein